MSSALRLSIIMVLLFATAALGLVAYNASLPKQVAPDAQSVPAPVTVAYLVAAHPLHKGALVREDDVAVHSAPSAPTGATLDTPEARAALRGSLVRKFLDKDAPFTPEDVLSPRDRGFLASVLAPDTRAISINVDAESGVSSLIWPGDEVDVVLTQVNEKSEPGRRALSEIILQSVRVIAIDQEIEQGAKENKDDKDNKAISALKATRSVSLQLTPEQVKAVAIAKELGKLSLAVRAAIKQRDSEDAGTTLDSDVSPALARQAAIARQNTEVIVYAGGKAEKFSVQKKDASQPPPERNGSRDVARNDSVVTSFSGDNAGNDARGSGSQP
jgi:pilus assembly protein CpaB